LTCGVWGGFNKPQKIYRGAFGRELALPVWVDVMNASAERYPAKQIPQPSTLKKIEICSRSGSLATDKCYDTVKSASGESVQKRTTYLEIATEKQKPTQLCNIHGDASARLVRDLPESEFPRATAAVDVKEVQPVIVKSPALLADKDPYNSAKPPVKAEEVAEKEPVQKEAAAKTDIKTTDDGKPILKAIPVEPQDKKPVEIRRAQPVGPLDEVPDDSLLKAATPPPETDLGD